MTPPLWRHGRQPLVKTLEAWPRVTTKLARRGLIQFFVMSHNKIKKIPTNQTVTYARVVADFRLQKADPHQICITTGGNLINFPGKLSTQTANLTTSKLMWNSILSTKGAKYMCLDINIFYLTTALDRYKYMKMPISLFPE
jgi:hypothetical protein